MSPSDRMRMQTRDDSSRRSRSNQRSGQAVTTVDVEASGFESPISELRTRGSIGGGTCESVTCLNCADDVTTREIVRREIPSYREPSRRVSTMRGVVARRESARHCLVIFFPSGDHAGSFEPRASVNIELLDRDSR